MNSQAFLIDTNVLIGLEDNRPVDPAFSSFLSLASKHHISVFVHEVAKDDILRDRDTNRRKISLSKLEKFQTLEKVRNVDRDLLDQQFGPLKSENDVVDAVLIHAVSIGAVDFLVSQDRGLHDRAARRSAELARRVLYVADAVQLLRTTFESVGTAIRSVEEVSAHTIPTTDEFFKSLREDYPKFDTWWREKCVEKRRRCWVVYDDGLAGLIVRKDETPADTDAVSKLAKILKICTFKVRAEKRGTKLGELLLKQAFWFAQANNYDLAYLTVYESQIALIDLLEYYGFRKAGSLDDGELVMEKHFARGPLSPVSGMTDYEAARLHYPRFIASKSTQGFIIPIQEEYHDALYPDLKVVFQQDLFDAGIGGRPLRPGNTIRKVYLCRSPSNLGAAGSLLFFYKGKSKLQPSQALTSLGVFEDFSWARSTKELLQMTGGRSVFGEKQLDQFQAHPSRPVRVINYLLARYFEPAIQVRELFALGIIRSYPQSIVALDSDRLGKLLKRVAFDFSVASE